MSFKLKLQLNKIYCIGPAELPIHDHLVASQELKMSKKLFDNVDCGDKVCSLDYRVVPTCIIYMPNPKTDCEIPCKMQNCKVEIKHFVECPLWTCVEKPTTLIPFTTTHTPTPTVTPSGNNDALYSSLAMNTLLIVALAFSIFKVVKYRRALRIPNTVVPNPNVEAGILRGTTVERDRHFSIAESDPLLSQRQSPTPSEDRQTLLSRLRAFEWSRSLNRWIQNERSGSDEVDQDQDVENQNNRSETNISFSNPGFNRVSNSNE